MIMQRNEFDKRVYFALTKRYSMTARNNAAMSFKQEMLKLIAALFLAVIE